MIDKHAEAFREEAYELLTDLEGSLLELEQSPDDAELIGKVFRVMHTIKGSGSMFGFDDIAEFTHGIETVYDRVRSGQIRVSKDLISLTLEARDIVKTMLDEPEGVALSRQEAEKVAVAFKSLVQAEEEGTDPPSIDSPPSVAASLSSHPPVGPSPTASALPPFQASLPPAQTRSFSSTNWLPWGKRPSRPLRTAYPVSTLSTPSSATPDGPSLSLPTGASMP